MRGRFEALEKGKIAILPIAIFFLFIAPDGAMGQSLPEGVMKILEAEAERGGSNIEGLVAYCEQLMETPLDINSATEGELAAFPLLSPFQVASILEYREQYGDILSRGELELVDGFNPERVERLLPFIVFGEDSSLHPPLNDNLSHRLILRSSGKFAKGSPWGHYGKYRFKMGERLQVGSTISSKGLSAHLRVGGIPIGGDLSIKSGVVGDYSVRLGQGLLVWNSFSLSGAGDPSSILKMGGGVVPYTASAPEDAFRGIGLSLGYADMVEGTLFFSEQEDRVVGGSAGFRGKRWKIGVNAIACGQKVWSGGASVDAVWSLGRFRLFSEGAVDFDGDGALLCGVVAPLNGSFEFSALLRWYSPGYTMEYAGAFSSISSCKDQMGSFFNILWTPLPDVVWRGIVDVVYYPEPRWGVKSPSFEVESSSEVEWSRGDHKVMLRGRYRYYGYEGRHQKGVRLHYGYKPTSGIYGAFRCEVVWNNIYKGILSPGVACYAECGYLYEGGKWEGVIRGTVYHIDEWDNRIYFYERDLPQSFSVPALYRRGWDVYGYIKYAPLSRVGLYLKASTRMLKGQLTLTF